MLAALPCPKQISVSELQRKRRPIVKVLQGGVSQSVVLPPMDRIYRFGAEN